LFSKLSSQLTPDGFEFLKYEERKEVNKSLLKDEANGRWVFGDSSLYPPRESLRKAVSQIGRPTWLNQCIPVQLWNVDPMPPCNVAEKLIRFKLIYAWSSQSKAPMNPLRLGDSPVMFPTIKARWTLLQCIVLEQIISFCTVSIDHNGAIYKSIHCACSRGSWLTCFMTHSPPPVTHHSQNTPKIDKTIYSIS